MRELKFLKDLPIKLTNTNKRILSVVGGDIYYDSNGNRYGFITFNNLGKSPLFSLQLFIREYSIDGKFVRDNEYFEPYIFYPKGNFVINEPIPLDKETEAIEVTIVKATLDRTNLINDRYVSFRAEDYADLYQRKAPIKKPGTATSFSFVQNEAPRAAGLGGDVEFEEGAPVDGAQPGLSIERENVPSELKEFGKPQKTFWHIIYPAIGLVFLLILFFFIASSVSAGVSEFNWMVNNGYI